VRRPSNIRAVWTGVVSGVVYGVTLRMIFELDVADAFFFAMSLAFMVVLPAVVGYLTVLPLESPSWRRRIFLPWLTCLLMAAVAAVIGWEGSICVALALPMMLVASSLGGILAAEVGRRRAVTAVMLILPLALSPLEAEIPSPVAHRVVRTRIEVHAPQDVVWAHIVSIPTIRDDEFHPRLVHLIGFPHPVAATLTGSGVGAVRRATFAGGVLFIETITEWVPPRVLAFDIRADTADIPAVTLDEHVTVGGRYFDMLEGRYRIEPRGQDTVVLHLSSRYRLSTHINFYTGPWSDYILRSIQESILEVIKERCERV
jgi:hypothetical protein